MTTSTLTKDEVLRVFFEELKTKIKNEKGRNDFLMILKYVYYSNDLVSPTYYWALSIKIVEMSKRLGITYGDWLSVMEVRKNE